MLSGSSCVSKSMKVSAISIHSRTHAASPAGVAPKRTMAHTVRTPVEKLDQRIARGDGCLAAGAAARAASGSLRPECSRRADRAPQDGHRDRGTRQVVGAALRAASPASSAHCSRQPRSSIFGRRWMTTFRKLPMHSPTSAATARRGSIASVIARRGRIAERTRVARCAAESAGVHALRTGPVNTRRDLAQSDDRSELEDRKVHRDHQAADHDAQEDDDDRLEQARQRGDCIVDFALEELGDLATASRRASPIPRRSASSA